MAIALPKKAIARYGPVFFHDDAAGLFLKGAYLFLQLLDLGLTLWARGIGLTELNPFINGMLGSPLKLLVVKLLVPLLILSLVPGRLLIPAILFLSFVVAWNIHGLLTLAL